MSSEELQKNKLALDEEDDSEMDKHIGEGDTESFELNEEYLSLKSELSEISRFLEAAVARAPVAVVAPTGANRQAAGEEVKPRLDDVLKCAVY